MELGTGNDMMLPDVAHNTLPAEYREHHGIAERRNNDLSTKNANNPLDFFINDDGTLRHVLEFNNSETYSTLNDLQWGYGELINFKGNPNYGKHVVAAKKLESRPGATVLVVSLFTTAEFVKQAAFTRLKNEIIADVRRHTEKKIIPLQFKTEHSLIQMLHEQIEATNQNENNHLDDKELVIEFKNLVIGILEKHNTSDIHIEVSNQPHQSKVRIREDGLLKDYKAYGYKHLFSVAQTAYNIIGGNKETGSAIDGATLDGTEPQSAKFVFTQDGRKYQLRVEVIPRTTVGGFDMVLRVLDFSADSNIRPLEQVGFNRTQLSQIMDAVLRPSGMVLVCGTTGSGKSETLAAEIQYLRSIVGDTKKIFSVENPVERNQPGVSQVSVEEKGGSNQKNSLSQKLVDTGRAFMRGDPDVLSVAEVRDNGTANLAVELAKTGHLLFTTMHTTNTNDVPSRFVSLGIDRANLESEDTISLLISQSLVRTLCPHCSQPMHELEPTDHRVVKSLNWLNELQLLDYAKHIRFARKGGCEHCDYSPDGRKGRTAIAEVLTPNNTIRKLWGAGKDIEAKKYWLETDGMTKLEHAIEKMCQGIIDPFVVVESVRIPSDSAKERKELNIPLFRPNLQ